MSTLRRALPYVSLITTASLASYAWLAASGEAGYDPSTVRTISTHHKTAPPGDRPDWVHAGLTPKAAVQDTVVAMAPSAPRTPRKMAAYGGAGETAAPDAATRPNDRKAREKAKRAGKKTAKKTAPVRARTSKIVKQTGPYDAARKSDRKWYSRFWPLGERVEVKGLKDSYVPFMTEKTDKKTIGQLPSRPKLMVERGDGFLATGKLHPGYNVPVLGAVWQPRLWAYAINRTAIQTFDAGRTDADRETELANRLDLFVNLQLTGTEKILLGLRPTDRNRPDRFTRYTFDGSTGNRFNDEFSFTPQTLFFEGDFGSLFPRLDRAGVKPIDFGFTVGRQPLVFQEGILINDTIDAVGLIRNNIPFPNTSNLRVSAMWAWNRLDRNDFRRNPGQEHMGGLFIAADTHVSTFNLDMIYVDDANKQPGLRGDAFYVGASAIQRLKALGGISTAFRVNSSFALQDEIPGNVIGDGTLITAEISKTPKGSDDIVYFNSFLGIDNFTQAGREAIVGGPLANTGILFASPSLGNYLAELDPFTSDSVVGGAIGYQAFWDDKRRNLILEVAGRHDLSGDGFDSLALGFQLQQAVGRHVQLQFESFYAFNEDRDNGAGARAEIQVVY